MAPAPSSTQLDQPLSTPEQRARLRRLSKMLLGNMDRLEVGVAVARSEDGLVNATDLQEDLGIAQSRVRNQLVAFAEAELLTALPRSAGKQWYQRREARFWEVCLLLYGDWMG